MPPKGGVALFFDRILKIGNYILGFLYMAESKKTIYRLYALPPTWKSVEKAENERFSRITPTPSPGYALIYTAGAQPKGSRRITKEREKLLTAADIQWLIECGATILAEEAAKQQTDFMQKLSERVDALEVELQRKHDELAEKGGLS